MWFVVYSSKRYVTKLLFAQLLNDVSLRHPGEEREDYHIRFSFGERNNGTITLSPCSCIKSEKRRVGNRGKERGRTVYKGFMRHYIFGIVPFLAYSLSFLHLNMQLLDGNPVCLTWASGKTQRFSSFYEAQVIIFSMVLFDLHSTTFWQQEDSSIRSTAFLCLIQRCKSHRKFYSRFRVFLFNYLEASIGSSPQN